MGARSRSKGRRGELELLAVLHDAGFADAERVHGQEEIGGGLGDLVCPATGRWESKRRKAMPEWAQIAPDVRAVAFREDRGAWYALVRLNDLLDLLRRVRLQTPQEARDDR